MDWQGTRVGSLEPLEICVPPAPRSLKTTRLGNTLVVKQSDSSIVGLTFLPRRILLRRLALLAMAIFGCLALSPAPTSQNSLRRIVVEGPKGIVLAPRDTLSYVLRWGKATNATSYKVTVTPAATPAGVTGGLPNSTTVTDTTIAFTASNLTYDSLSFTATVTAFRGTRQNPTNATATWFVVKLPGTPGPIKIDSSAVPPPLASLDVTVTPATIVVNQTGQACAFFRFSNGLVGMRSIDAPACSAVYTSKYTTAQRAVGCQIQDWLDGTNVCTTALTRTILRYAFAGV